MMEKLGLTAFAAKAAGVFAYMVSEAVLGKTRFGSWLGLAKAITWAIVSFTVARVFGMFKKRAGDAPQKEKSDGDGNTGN